MKWFLSFLAAAVIIAFLWVNQPQSLDASNKPTIAFFEAHAGGCGWYAKTIGAQRERKLAQVQTDCSGGHVAFHPHASEAIIWFKHGDEPPMQWRVDLRASHDTRLPPPPHGDLIAFAYDETGQLLAFTIDQNLSVKHDAQGAYFTSQGRNYRLPASAGGVYGLAHSFVWLESNWQLSETVSTPCCEPGAKGIYALDAYQQVTGSAQLLDLQSEQLLRPYRDATTVLDTAILAGLPLQPPRRQGFWKSVKSPGWKTNLLVFATGSSPSALTALLLASTDSGYQKLDGWDLDDSRLIAVQDLGPYALISEAYTGEQPRVYDMVKGKLVFAQPTWQGAVFWPQSKSKSKQP